MYLENRLLKDVCLALETPRILLLSTQPSKQKNQTLNNSPDGCGSHGWSVFLWTGGLQFDFQSGFPLVDVSLPPVRIFKKANKRANKKKKPLGNSFTR